MSVMDYDLETVLAHVLDRERTNFLYAASDCHDIQPLKISEEEWEERRQMAIKNGVLNINENLNQFARWTTGHVYCSALRLWEEAVHMGTIKLVKEDQFEPGIQLDPR